MNLAQMNAHNLREHWASLSEEERRSLFFSLPRSESEEIFLNLSSRDQVEILCCMTGVEKRSWVRLLALDDVADLLQEMEEPDRKEALALLDDTTRLEVQGLLAYAEDQAGGLMTPHYLRLRPDMSVEESLRYIRAQTRNHEETVYYLYVLDNSHILLGTVSFRELVLAPPSKYIREIMRTNLVKVGETVDREEVSGIFAKYNLLALPVVDPHGVMKGVVTYDDIMTVVQEEATEDIQKMGGMEALDAPYLSVGFHEMIRKRAGWLVVLFAGEMLTASAMKVYETEIESAVILSTFIPLIISSGGNSGSQATTLIIRSLALKELRIKDWYRVLGREMGAGVALGVILGVIGACRIALWEGIWPDYYGTVWKLLSMTVFTSLIGVVLWGTLAGSMLPFLLKKLKLDPATASAPMVATMVDVVGLIIYFTVASFILLPHIR